MSEWGRLQEVFHDELDRQGVKGADVNGLIRAVVNVADFFPGLLGHKHDPRCLACVVLSRATVMAFAVEAGLATGPDDADDVVRSIASRLATPLPESAP